jgi:Ca2+-binding EF-hand superfamily protein
MMAVYDLDGNGKLNQQELLAVGIDVVSEKITDEKINRKIREI